MSIDVENQDGITIITIHQKRATAEIAREFKDFLFNLIEQQNVSSIVLDLVDVHFMDSFFIGAIVSALKKIRLAGGDIRILNLKQPLTPVFQLMHLDEVFQVFTTKQEVITSFQKS